MQSKIIKTILKEVESSESEIVDVCSKLVQFPTKNPPGYTSEIVNYIKSYFDMNNIDSRIFQRTEGKANICAKIPGKKPGKIAYLMHLDVVPEGEISLWKHPPYGGIVAEGKVYGRGSCDMKGSAAASMVAAKIISKIDPKHRCTCDFWFTCDEEYGGPDGIRWLLETGEFNADLCLEGDCFMFPGDPSIDVGMSGGLGTTIKVIGKAAHGSQPQMGDNAIDKLIKVIGYAKKLQDFPLEVFDEMKTVYESSIKYYEKQTSLASTEKAGFIKSFHNPTVSLNMIKGGIRRNVVPDSAEAILDIRIRSGCLMTPIKDRLQELIRESGVEGVKVEYRELNPGYYENPESEPVKKLVKVVELTTGLTPALKIMTGGNDCMWIKRAGIKMPCIGFGAGDEGLLHLTNEYVSIVNLIIVTKVYSVFPIYF